MRTAEFKWKRQRGVAAIIVGVTLTVLVGFLGLVVDTGRLYVTKTELQTAVDACALAGARYLGSPTQARLEMARDVGKAVGESGNRAVFQQESVLIDPPTFSDSIDGTYTSPGADAANMKYIQCVARKDSILNSFMQVLGADFRVSSVTAVAKASVVAGGSNCFLPVAMCKPAVNDQFEIGKWYYGRTSASNEQANVGNFRWIKLENEVDQTGADRFRDRLGGAACTEITSTTKVDGVPGQISSADPVFNTKFGLYKGNVERYVPDLVGYAFVEPAFGSLKSGTFQKSGGDYANKTAYEAYEEILARPETSQRGFQTPTYQDTTGNSANEITREVFRFSSGSSENFQILSGDQLADANSGSLQRRLVTLPIVDCDKLAQSNPNIVPNEGVACMFLLHPIGDTGSIAPSDPPVPQAITNGNVNCPADKFNSTNLTCSSSATLTVSQGTGNCNCSVELSNGKCQGKEAELVCSTPGGIDLANLMRLEYIGDATASGSPCTSAGAPGAGFAAVPGLVQ